MQGIIDIVIAAIGLVIAIIQIIGEVRQRRKDKEEKEKIEKERDIIKQLATSNNSLMRVMEQFGEMINKINNMGEGGNENLQLFIDETNESIQMYNAYINHITTIYTNMLRNEERFSMSYGFGRYIDAYRKFLANTVVLDRAVLAQQMLFQYIEEHRDKAPDPEVLAALANAITGELQKLYETLNYIKPYAEEIKLKYM